MYNGSRLAAAAGMTLKMRFIMSKHDLDKAPQINS